MRKRGVRDDIFKYNICKNTWKALPPCPTYEHGLAALRNELVAIGGKTKHRATNESTNVVYTLKKRTWKKVLPRMSTPRCHLSAVSVNYNTIIAAGGVISVNTVGKSVLSDSVEVYMHGRAQWYSARNLPFPSSLLSTVLIGNSCYVLGGIATPRATFQTSLFSLLENAASADTTTAATTWKQLSGNHPLTHSSPVGMDGKIIAMGGSVDANLRRGTRFISSYDFAADTWVECKGAQLQVPLYRTGIVKLDDSSVMVVGGQTKSQQFAETVYIAKTN